MGLKGYSEAAASVRLSSQWWPLQKLFTSALDTAFPWHLCCLAAVNERLSPFSINVVNYLLLFIQVVQQQLSKRFLFMIRKYNIIQYQCFWKVISQTIAYCSHRTSIPKHLFLTAHTLGNVRILHPTLKSFLISKGLKYCYVKRSSRVKLF